MTTDIAGSTETIPFSKPYLAPGTMDRLEAVMTSDHVRGDGRFSAAATAKLRAITGGGDALLTTSATHALEMASRLLELGQGDEVILPSYTFPSAAAAVAVTGAVAVFVDIDERGNIDASQVANALTDRTRAISVLHYGGVPADLGALREIASGAGIHLIEDNAHGLGVEFEGSHLGRFGTFGVQSFHDTKNVHCGEGGALLINDPRLLLGAEIMREKGTNRARFLRGEVDRYSWVRWGSSYLPSELNAAALDAQLAAFEDIQHMRTGIWDAYRWQLADWAAATRVTLMDPPGGVHAAHLFYFLMPDWNRRTQMLRFLRSRGIGATFHYVPLDTSEAGERYGRRLHRLTRSEDFSHRIVRLPLWPGMTADDVERVVGAVTGWRPDWV